MKKNPRLHLDHLLESATRIQQYLEGVSLTDYLQNQLLRDAVERRFITLGEAMNRLKRDAPDLHARIRDVGPIVAFRNRVVHGYDMLTDDVVYDIAQQDLPPLIQDTQSLLHELDPTTGSPP